VVKGIQTAQQGVDKLADGLDSGVRSAATRKAQVQSTVEKLQAQLDGLSSQLRGAIESLRGQ
jgi:X-X-X-Leu-X-X-Gly heptad repeat protein